MENIILKLPSGRLINMEKFVSMTNDFGIDCYVRLDGDVKLCITNDDARALYARLERYCEPLHAPSEIMAEVETRLCGNSDWDTENDKRYGW